MRSAPLALALLLLGASASGAQTGKDWQSVFPVEKKTLGVKGSNPYFILTLRYQLSYKNGNDTDTVTVLNGSKLIDGVEARVVEDRAEIVSDSERVSTPAGMFEKCIQTLKTSALKKNMADHKWYAAGMGPVKDGKMLLIGYVSK